MPGFFGETSSAIINPLGAIWLAIVNQLPGIVGAIIVLIIGCFVAVILGHALRVILEKLKVDEYVRKGHLTKAIGHTHIPAIAGEIFKWYIIILFLQQAVALINLGSLSVLLDRFVIWLPSLIVAVIVLLFGIAVANYLQLKILEHSSQKGARTGSSILKFVIIIMVIILALKQIGVEVSILENVFLLIIGALAIGIALALGIGLGLGLRKQSEEIINQVRRNF